MVSPQAAAEAQMMMIMMTTYTLTMMGVRIPMRAG